MTTHYEVLGVPEDATDEQIKAAFRQIAVVCHPDKTSDESARQRMLAASTAYSVLRSPEERAAYNKSLRGSQKRRHVKKPPPPPKPCTSCGEPVFPGTTQCWKCLLGNAIQEERAKKDSAKAAALKAQTAALKAKILSSQAQSEARDEAARKLAATARKLREVAKKARDQEEERRVRDEFRREAAMREEALNEDLRRARETSTHGYEDPIRTPDAETLFQAVLSESALRAARGVQKNGVDVWLHMTPDLKVEPRGDAADLAREVHKGLKQANRLLSRVKRWIGG